MYNQVIQNAKGTDKIHAILEVKESIYCKGRTSATRCHSG